MGLPLFIIELIITIVCFPILIIIYYYLFKAPLKKIYTTEQRFKHFITLLGITLLAILIANLIRFTLGISLSYFFKDLHIINTIGNLLWFTAHGDTSIAITIASTINLLIISGCIHQSIYHTFKKSNLYTSISKYNIKTTILVCIPVTYWLLVPFIF